MSAGLKLHLGCGPFKIPGWENHDRDVDLCKPLPFEGGSAKAIFIEHVFEHLTIQQGWNFLLEAWRVLEAKGVVRVWRVRSQEYTDMVKSKGWGDGTPASSIRHLVFGHGHQSLWTVDLLMTVLSACGFDPREAGVGESINPDLRGLEQHGNSIGQHANWVESIVVEGVKI
jgi:hypothetical protein